MANAISRLPTFEYATPGPELEIAAFLVEDGDDPGRYAVIYKVDTDSSTKSDWGPFDVQDDQRILESMDVFSVLAVDVEAELSAVTIDGIRHAQEMTRNAT